MEWIKQTWEQSSPNDFLNADQYLAWKEIMLSKSLDHCGGRWIHSKATETLEFELIQKIWCQRDYGGISFQEWTNFSADFREHVGKE